MKSRKVKLLRVVVALAVLAYVLSGLYIIRPDEQGVVRRFGAIAGPPREPGAHFGLPWGLDQVTRVKRREVKQVTIGVPRVTDGTLGTGTVEYLTGDRNLVNVQATVQYTVSDPARYLFQAVSVDALVARAAEGTLAAELAVASVDWILTRGKDDLRTRVAGRLRQLAQAYGVGILIERVNISAVEPPPEVAEAFAAVVSAMREREQKVNEAKRYANKITAEAQGEARREIDQAEARRDQLINKTRGDTDRFASLLEKYRRAPKLTATRMYLETMREILPRFRSKLIVDPESKLDLSIIPDKALDER